MHQPIEALAAAAVDLLLRRGETPDLPVRELLLPGTLVRRGSARL